MGDTAYVSELPECSFCDEPATYDGKTSMDGRWAYMCDEHFNDLGLGLGTGKGQHLVVGEEPERTTDQIRSEILAALEVGDWNAAEEAIGDRDIAEFL